MSASSVTCCTNARERKTSCLSRLPILFVTLSPSTVTILSKKKSSAHARRSSFHARPNTTQRKSWTVNCFISSAILNKGQCALDLLEPHIHCKTHACSRKLTQGEQDSVNAETHRLSDERNCLQATRKDQGPFSNGCLQSSRLLRQSIAYYELNSTATDTSRATKD